ncbi:MAG: cupin domain-containing protein [Clostridiales bacterium]|nr:cupin domain-containing protein [Clostridiales bacterium]
MTEQLRDIGERLATMRDIAGISVEEMAERLDITPEQYTAYEIGENDFSFSMLFNCASILGVDIQDLISGETPRLSTCSVVRKGKGYSIKREDAYDYKHLAYTFRNKKAEPFLVTVEPSDDAAEMHEHDGQEFNYILSGKIAFYIGDVSYILNKGDSVYFDASIPHAEKALDDTAKFIAVVLK